MITLMQTVSRFCAITLDTLLYGNSTLSLQANSDIFEAVQLFLKQTNRFLSKYKYVTESVPPVIKCVNMLLEAWMHTIILYVVNLNY